MAGRIIEEHERRDFPDEWMAQQNATTTERGYGAKAREQRPENPVVPRRLPSTQESPVPAYEVGPHLKGKKLALKIEQLDQFEADVQDEGMTIRTMDGNTERDGNQDALMLVRMMRRNLRPGE